MQAPPLFDEQVCVCLAAIEYVFQSCMQAPPLFDLELLIGMGPLGAVFQSCMQAPPLFDCPTNSIAREATSRYTFRDPRFWKVFFAQNASPTKHFTDHSASRAKREATLRHAITAPRAQLFSFTCRTGDQPRANCPSTPSPLFTQPVHRGESRTLSSSRPPEMFASFYKDVYLLADRFVYQHVLAFVESEIQGMQASGYDRMFITGESRRSCLKKRDF